MRQHRRRGRHPGAAASPVAQAADPPPARGRDRRHQAEQRPQGHRELGAFLDLCRVYKVRLVSIHDRIDSTNQLFPETTAGDVLDTISRISTEAKATRRSEARILRTGRQKQKKTKSALRLDREKTIVNMYKSGHSIDDIWKVSGYKSRTSVFRVLNRNGVELNRISRSSSPAATGTTDNE